MHTEHPKVSVIVTTYNRFELLQVTIESILNQSFTDFELIVVDNYSDYDFVGLLESYGDERLRYFQNRNNGIIAANRNLGIRQSLGEFIAFCDDDDSWMPNKLELQLSEVEKKANMSNSRLLVYSNASLFGDKIRPYDSRKKLVRTFNDFILRSDIFFSSILVSRTELTRFDEGKEIVGAEDFKFIGTLFLEGYKLIFVNEALIRYRVSKSSASNVHRNKAIFRRIYIVMYLVLRYDPKRVRIWRFTHSLLLQWFKSSINEVRIKSLK